MHSYARFRAVECCILVMAPQQASISFLYHPAQHDVLAIGKGIIYGTRGVQ